VASFEAILVSKSSIPLLTFAKSLEAVLAESDNIYNNSSGDLSVISIFRMFSNVLLNK